MHALQARGEINIPSERWIVEVGEEEIIVDPNLTLAQKVRVILFKAILRSSTPAHKYFGLGFDAGISKETIPVTFNRSGAHVTLPELEIHEDDQRLSDMVLQPIPSGPNPSPA